MSKDKKLVSFDWAIKYLLKSKSGHIAIEGFLNALIRYHNEDQLPIKIIALLDSESLKESWEKKRSLADLLVEDTNGHKYIVEIERAVDKTIMHKAVFNTSRTIVDAVPAGKSIEYFEVKKVFHVTLAYFEFGNGNLFHGKTIIKDIETDKPLDFTVKNPKTDEIIEAHNIFPEYYFISIPNFDDNVREAIDEWMFVIKNERGKPEFKSQGIREAIKRMDYLKLSEEERMQWDIHRKNISDMHYKIETSFEQGIEKGGKNKQLEIARNLKKASVPIDVIAESTGLTTAEIEKL